MADKKNAVKKKWSFSVLMEKNSFVLILSMVLAVVFWCIVSMNQTNNVDKIFQNVSVRLNTESLSSANGKLKIYGTTEYYVDVTVKGKSYLINDSKFADHIVVTASLSSVSAAGSYNLPLTASIDGYSEADAEIKSISKTGISVYLDEEAEKSFPLKVEVLQGENYKLQPGFTLGEATLSKENVVLVGPAMEINKITEVKAVATLNQTVSENQVLQATIVPVGAGENYDFGNVSPKNDESVYINIPVTFSSEYKPVVTFTNLPKDYEESGVEYTVYPSTVTVTAATGDLQLINANEISIGTIDFSEIDNEKKTFRFSAEDLPYTFSEEIASFSVTVDMSSLAKRWVEVPVSTEGVKLPAGAKLLTESVKSVQIIGEENQVMKLESPDLYAVPVLDGVTLKKGTNTVPVKIVLKKLTNAWAFNTYTVEIEVP